MLISDPRSAPSRRVAVVHRK